MAKRIPFGVNEIVILEAGESIKNQCSNGDAAITQEADGFMVTFVGVDGGMNSWEGAFETAEEAAEMILNA